MSPTPTLNIYLFEGPIVIKVIGSIGMQPILHAILFLMLALAILRICRSRLF
jgi:hypothetical protein